MDVVNFDALKAQGRILDLANVDLEEDYLIIGKYTNKYTTDNFKYTKYPIYAIKAGDVIGVQSVTGLNTDNTDPLNPIVKISVDGTTITGQGTPASPLVAPKTYKVYVAILDQTGTNNPVVTILENTLGTINITRSSTGEYTIASSGLFTLNKTSFDITPIQGFIKQTPLNDVNTIGFETRNTSNVTTDGLLISKKLEIRVYN